MALPEQNALARPRFAEASFEALAAKERLRTAGTNLA
jgi:hypothetical protein